jgi:hypothetical protein
MNSFFFAFEVFHALQIEFTDDVSKITVTSIVTGHENNLFT